MPAVFFVAAWVAHAARPVRSEEELIDTFKHAASSMTFDPSTKIRTGIGCARWVEFDVGHSTDGCGRRA
jgi:hypothetical protein